MENREPKLTETAGAVTHHVSKFNKAWKEWAVFIGAIGVVLSVFLAGANYLMGKQFEAHMNNGQLGQMLASLTSKDAEQDSRLLSHDEYISSQIEKNILKQYDKIKKENFSDIKKEDLEDALRDFPKLKDPKPEVVRGYKAIETYYNENY